MTKTKLSTLAALAALAAPSAALADAAPGAPEATATTPAQRTGGSLLVDAKVGGVLSFGGLDPNVRPALSIGYVFPWMNRSFAAALSADYASLKQDGRQTDPRVPAGSYNWHITEQELTVMPVFLYRLTSLGKLVPYGGVGPRIYMLRSTVYGSAAGTPMAETSEQSTKVGVGVPLGVEYALGPGALLGELLLEYGGLDHKATGDTNTGGLSLFLGYRFMP